MGGVHLRQEVGALSLVGVNPAHIVVAVEVKALAVAVMTTLHIAVVDVIHIPGLDTTSDVSVNEHLDITVKHRWVLCNRSETRF